MFRLFLKRIQRPTRSFLTGTFFIIVLTIGIFTWIYDAWLSPVSKDDPYAYMEAITANYPPEKAESILLNYLKENPDNQEVLSKIIDVRLNRESDVNDSLPKNPDGTVDSLWKEIGAVSNFSKGTVVTWYLYKKKGLDPAFAYIEKSGLIDRDPLLAGELLYEEEKYKEALPYFIRSEKLAEKKIYDEQYVAWYLINSYIYLEEFSKVKALLENDAYKKVCGPDCLYGFYREQKNYLRMVPELMKSEFSNYRLEALVVALLTGAGWLFFVITLGGIRNWKLSGSYLTVIALVMGILSSYVTLTVAVIQDHTWGFDGSGIEDPLRLAMYYLVGVGAREELIKLLFFAPLAFFLSGKNLQNGVREREVNMSKVLTLSSLVGLGFAMDENINYYMQFAGTIVIDRFITANFFHMALTGYAGYYFVRALQNGSEEWTDFILRLLMVIALHGLYDFLLSTENGYFFSMMIFVYISREYFRLFPETNLTADASKISLPFIFISALAVSVGMGYFLAAHYLGLVPAIKTTIAAMLGAAVILFMFFHELKHLVYRN